MIKRFKRNYTSMVVESEIILTVSFILALFMLSFAIILMTAYGKYTYENYEVYRVVDMLNNNTFIVLFEGIIGSAFINEYILKHR